MQLHNGRIIENVFDFDIKEYWDPEMFAHVMSLINRYGGHSRFPFSDAQHTLLVSDLILEETNNFKWALGGQIHDCSEVIFGDVIRPIKHMPEMDQYRAAERECTNKIYRLHGIEPTEEFEEMIEHYDRIALSTEAYWLKDTSHPIWKPYIESHPPRLDYLIQEEDWREVKEKWIARYKFLTER